MKICNCSYYKTKAYGLNPQNHNHDCPMYKIDNSPFVEEWLDENAKIRYDENQKSHSEKQKSRDKKIGDKG